MSINFSCAPEKVDELVAKAESIIKQIAAGEISDTLIKNEKERWYKARESGF